MAYRMKRATLFWVSGVATGAFIARFSGGKKFNIRSYQ